MLTKLHKGFSLIELMIIASIIGIIAAVFLPALTGSKPRSSEGYSQGYSQPQVQQNNYSVACIDSKQYAISKNGNAHPIMDGSQHKECKL